MSTEQTPGAPTGQEWAEAALEGVRRVESHFADPTEQEYADAVLEQLAALIDREREAAKAEAEQRGRDAVRADVEALVAEQSATTPTASASQIDAGIRASDRDWAARLRAILTRHERPEGEAVEPHAYGVEVLVNSGSPSAYWRLDDEADVRETQESAELEREALIDCGHPPEMVRVVALTVTRKPEAGEQR